MAQTIASLGESVRLVSSSTHIGPAIAALRERGVDHGIEIPGTIRTCLHRERDGRITELLEPGPELDGVARKNAATFRRLALIPIWP